MEYWLKQIDKPLYEDLLWSRPQNKRTAGKLLIIGGHEQAFATPVGAFTLALQAGAGSVKTLLPSTVQKIVGNHLEDVYFVPSTKSGSLAKSALAELLDYASWADGVLLAGDFGRNSETAIVLELFVQKYPGQITISGDGVDYFYARPAELLQRDKTTIVASTTQLQKLLVRHGSMRPVYSGMQLQQLVEVLHKLSLEMSSHFISHYQDVVTVAVNGHVSTTALASDDWQIQAASRAAVWWLQNPSKPFEALTTGQYQAQ